MEQVSGCLCGQIIPVSERSLLCLCSAAAKVSLWAEEKNKKTNCIPLENETNCAHFATGGVSECRYRESVLLNSVCSPVVHCVRPQSGSAICVMFSSYESSLFFFFSKTFSRAAVLVSENEP